MKPPSQHDMLLALTLAIWSLGGCSMTPDPNTDETRMEKEEKIHQILLDQQQAWNDGELDRFLFWYDHSPDLTFISGDAVQRGFTETSKRYHRRYPDREAMGTLEFSDLEVRLLCEDTALVTGAWALKRTEDRPRGRFTLLLMKKDAGWRITLDHTSSHTE